MYNKTKRGGLIPAFEADLKSLNYQAKEKLFTCEYCGSLILTEDNRQELCDGPIWCTSLLP